MRKWRKGYFSIEASMIMPVVLFLYLMIILAALYMYCRCAISQDTFLLGMRAGGFTYGENEYGEVIYGKEGAKEWSVHAYVEERLEKRKNSYPVYSYIEGSCIVNEKSVCIQTVCGGSRGTMQKQVQKRNPIAMIREGRKG